MKKQIVALTLILCMGLIGFGTAEAGPTKLTYSNFFPPAHIQSKLAQAWCEEVEKRTNGEVVVEYFPGQTLTKARQVYDGVVEGISDIGFYGGKNGDGWSRQNKLMNPPDGQWIAPIMRKSPPFRM